jgi:hypothetical protein
MAVRYKRHWMITCPRSRYKTSICCLYCSLFYPRLLCYDRHCSNIRPISIFSEPVHLPVIHFDWVVHCLPRGAKTAGERWWLLDLNSISRNFGCQGSFGAGEDHRRYDDYARWLSAKKDKEIRIEWSEGNIYVLVSSVTSCGMFNLMHVKPSAYLLHMAIMLLDVCNRRHASKYISSLQRRRWQV